jgi:hypothetical protein
VVTDNTSRKVCELSNSIGFVHEDMLNSFRSSQGDTETSSSGRNNARHSSVFNEVSTVSNSFKGFSRVEQMSESGLSNDDEAKVEQVSDGRWTREEHYCFLKAVAVYGREVGK